MRYVRRTVIGASRRVAPTRAVVPGATCAMGGRDRRILFRGAVEPACAAVGGMSVVVVLQPHRIGSASRVGQRALRGCVTRRMRVVFLLAGGPQGDTERGVARREVVV
eukprot:scaffold96999_cov37-Tisochrysis_lutea.AAC.3